MAYPTRLFSRIILLLILLQIIHATQKSNSLSFKMIYWDSPDSPLYRENLTDKDRMQDLIQMSDIRVKILANSIAYKNNSSRFLHPQFVVRPSMSKQPFLYLVKVGVGTFDSVPKFKPYYLAIDTGSDITWLQCEGCEPNCFQQVNPVFPKSQSHTYNPFPCSDCPPNTDCRKDSCTLSRLYGDGSSARLIVAKETFTFESTDYPFVAISELLFGCAIDVQNFAPGISPNNQVNGLMGLSYGDYSFPTLTSHITGGQFSYCLQPMLNGPPSPPPMFLRFGADVIRKPGMKSTPMSRVDDHTLYYLNLQGVSISTRRLGIPPEVFRIKSTGMGGSTIDSASVTTYITPEAYGPFEHALAAHVEANNPNLRRTDPEIRPFKLCYERFQDPVKITLPAITFHFENNADFVILAATTIYADKTREGLSRICYMFFESDISQAYLTMLGAYHQVNYRIVYDVKNSQLLFGQDDCSTGN